MALVDYLIKESGGERGEIKDLEGELRYRIPHAAVETLRTEWMPGLTSKALTGNFTYATATDVLTSAGNQFTSAMVGHTITVTGRAAHTILSYTTPGTVKVSHQAANYGPTALASVSANRVWPADSALTGLDATFARTLKYYEMEPDCPGYPGFSLVRNLYRTPTWDHVIFDQPNRAVLEIDFSGEATELDSELVTPFAQIVGPAVEAEDYATAAWKGTPFEWRVCRGSNTAYLPRCVMKVRTAATSIDLSTLWGLMGKTNSDTTLAALGITKANTHLCIGARVSREYRIGSLWLVEYIFLYDPGWTDATPTWHSGFTCMSKKYVSAILEAATYKLNAETSAYDVVDRPRQTLTWIPRFNDALNVEIERDLTRGETSFSDISAMLEWYQ